jgi:hypothetical protein
MSRPLSVNQSCRVLRVPVEAHRVAHARGPPRRAAIRGGVQAGDVGVAVRVRGADVAGGAHRDVEGAVRAEGDEFPAVVALPREAPGHHPRHRGPCQARRHPIEGDDARHLGDIQATVAPGHTDRLGQPPGQHMDPGGTADVDLHPIHLARLTAAHIHHATPAREIPQGHPPGIGHLIGEHLDPEAGRQAQALHRQSGRYAEACSQCQAQT